MANNTKIGTSNTNLVLETAGRVYIQVGDRLYDLNFKDKNQGNVTVKQDSSKDIDLSGYVTIDLLKGMDFVRKSAIENVDDKIININSLLSELKQRVDDFTVNNLWEKIDDTLKPVNDEGIFTESFISTKGLDNEAFHSVYMNKDDILEILGIENIESLIGSSDWVSIYGSPSSEVKTIYGQEYWKEGHPIDIDITQNLDAGLIHASEGIYTNKFVSVRGNDSEAILAGAVDMETVFDSLREYDNNPSHIINEGYLPKLPDYILGQVMYGGTVSFGGSTILSESFKRKYGITSFSVSYENASDYEGVYFIALNDLGYFAQIPDVRTGDWVISTGLEWTKIDNTDAVTSVVGLIGNITKESLLAALGLSGNYTAFGSENYFWKNGNPNNIPVTANIQAAEIYATTGVKSDGYISAKGYDNESIQGPAQIDENDIWRILEENDDSKKIHHSHIPDNYITIETLETDILSGYRRLENGIFDVDVIVSGKVIANSVSSNVLNQEAGGSYSSFDEDIMWGLLESQGNKVIHFSHIPNIYATIDWVNDNGYLTESDLSEYRLLTDGNFNNVDVSISRDSHNEWASLSLKSGELHWYIKTIGNATNKDLVINTNASNHNFLFQNNGGFISSGNIIARGAMSAEDTNLNAYSNTASFDEDIMWSILEGGNSRQINPSHISTALSSYATIMWVNSNFLKNYALDGYATEDYVAENYLGKNDTAKAAEKLSSTHTLWGQQFDGTQNVFGSLTDVEHIIATGDITTDGSISACGFYSNPDQLWSLFDEYIMWQTLLSPGSNQIDKTHINDALSDYTGSLYITVLDKTIRIGDSVDVEDIISALNTSGKYLTDTTYTLSQDPNNGHRLIFTPSSGDATEIIMPDNDTTYCAGYGLELVDSNQFNLLFATNSSVGGIIIGDGLSIANGKANVVYAPKLKQTVKLWGQDFNGESNVSGSLINVIHIEASGDIKTIGSISAQQYNQYGEMIGSQFDEITMWEILANSGNEQIGKNHMSTVLNEYASIDWAEYEFLKKNDIYDWAKSPNKPLYNFNEINGSVTNSQLAGSIQNDKLVNSSINIVGSNVSLGGSISTTIIANALSNASYKLTDTTYTLLQDQNDGHKLTFTSSSGNSVSIIIPDNDTKYSAGEGLSKSNTNEFSVNYATHTNIGGIKIGDGLKNANGKTEVEYAPRLKYTKTLWGQNFDGSNNVIGSLSSVENITASGDIVTSGAISAQSNNQLSSNMGFGFDDDVMWQLLSSSGSGNQIHSDHLITALSNYSLIDNTISNVVASGTKLAFTKGNSIIEITTQDTTYSIPSVTNATGLFTWSEKQKLANIAAGANNYTLPTASSSQLGGIKVGYSSSNKKYAVKLDNENAYVEVQWENTWRPVVNNLESDSETSSLSAKQGKAIWNSRGVANGIASLDGSGKVPSSQLPSYVDDVLEYSSQNAFPNSNNAESGKIYVDISTNKTYRWSGSGYIEISASLALGETSATAYRGDRGKEMYDYYNSVKGWINKLSPILYENNGNVYSTTNIVTLGSISASEYNQSSTSIGTYFEESIMWSLLSNATNQQINLSHINLSNYATIPYVEESRVKIINLL